MVSLSRAAAAIWTELPLFTTQTGMYRHVVIYCAYLNHADPKNLVIWGYRTTLCVISVLYLTQ